jgi:hypothetical protein
MKLIKVEEVQDGMVVSKLIEDRLGRAILKPGDTLKTSFASRLNKWGVAEIWIESEAEEEEDGDDDKNHKAGVSTARTALDKKFARYADDSHMGLLKKITKHYLSDSRLKDHLS